MEFQVQRGSMRRVAPKPLASNVGMIIAPRRASLRRPNGLQGKRRIVLGFRCVRVQAQGGWDDDDSRQNNDEQSKWGYASPPPAVPAVYSTYSTTPNPDPYGKYASTGSQKQQPPAGRGGAFEAAARVQALIQRQRAAGRALPASTGGPPSPERRAGRGSASSGNQGQQWNSVQDEVARLRRKLEGAQGDVAIRREAENLVMEQFAMTGAAQGRERELQMALDEANMRVSQLVADSRVWQEAHQAAERASDAAMQEVQALRRELGEAEDRQEELSAELREQTVMIEELTQLAADATIMSEAYNPDEIEKASSKLSQTGAELARAQSALESLEATLRRKIQEYDTRLEEMDESEDRIKEYEEQLQLQQLEIARLEGELAMLHSRVLELEAQLAERPGTEELARMEAEISAPLEAAEAALAEMVNATNRQQDQLSRKIRGLEGEVEALRAGGSMDWDRDGESEGMFSREYLEQELRKARAEATSTREQELAAQVRALEEELAQAVRPEDIAMMASQMQIADPELESRIQQLEQELYNAISTTGVASQQKEELLLAQIRDLESQLARSFTETDVSQLEASLAAPLLEARERVARLEAELAASGAEKALKTADPAELAKLNKEMLTLRHELRDVKSSRDHAARARETELQGQIKSLEQRLEQADIQTKEFNSMREELRAPLEEARATVAQLEKQLEEEKQQAGKRMVREGARVRDELAAKMSQLEAELRTAKNSSSDEAAAREKALLDRISVLEDQLSKSLTEDDIDVITKQIEEPLIEARARVAMLEEEVRTASAIVISTRDELNAQIHALTAELDIAKQTKGAESDEKCAELLGMIRELEVMLARSVTEEDVKALEGHIQAPLMEARAKVSKLEEQLKDAGDRAAKAREELSGQIRTLESQVEQAQRAQSSMSSHDAQREQALLTKVKELETRLDEQVRQSGARVIKEGAKVREEMASKLRTLEAELAGMRAAKEDTAKEDALKAKIQSLERQMEEELSKAGAMMITTRSELTSKINSLESRLVEAQMEKASTSSAREQELLAQIRTLETQMARSLTEEDVRALEAKIQAPLADARGMVLELERELRDAQAQAASSRREFTTHIERLEEELANNKNSGSVSSKREQELLAEIRNVETQLAKSVDMEELAAFEKRVQAPLTAAKRKVAELEEELRAQGKEVIRAGARARTEMAEQMRSLRAEIEAAKAANAAAPSESEAQLVAQIRQLEEQLARSLTHEDIAELEGQLQAPLLQARERISQLEAELHAAGSGMNNEQAAEYATRVRQLEQELLTAQRALADAQSEAQAKDQQTAAANGDFLFQIRKLEEELARSLTMQEVDEMQGQMEVPLKEAQAKVTLLEDQLRGAATSMISEREEQLNAQMRQLEVQLAAAVPQEEFAQLQAEMRAQNQQLQDTLARSGSEADVKAIQLELESKICELETLLENSVPLEDVEKREQDLKDQIASLEEDLAFDDLTDIQAAIHEKMRQLEAEISASSDQSTASELSSAQELKRLKSKMATMWTEEEVQELEADLRRPLAEAQERVRELMSRLGGESGDEEKLQETLARVIELEIQIANMYTKEEVQEQEASLARALDEASQRVQELETTIQNIMFDTASDGKVQALLSQVRSLETRTAKMVPMAEVKQLEEEMAMLLRDAQAKVAGLQSQVQALEAARDGARIQESDERVNKLLTSVMELDSQLKQDVSKAKAAGSTSSTVQSLLGAQMRVSQLQVDMANLKSTLVDERGEALLERTRALEEELEYMISAEELEDVVQSQRAALFDITAATFSADRVPFKRESKFKLARNNDSTSEAFRRGGGNFKWLRKNFTGQKYEKP